MINDRLFIGLFMLFAFSMNAQTNEAVTAYNNAVQAHRAKDYFGTVKLLETAITASPDFIQAQRLMAESHQILGDEEKARRYFSNVLELTPENTDVMYRYAMTYVREGKEAEAKDALTKILDKNPKHAKALKQLGVYEHNNRIKEKQVTVVSKTENKGVEKATTSQAKQASSKASINTLSSVTATKYANKGAGYYNEKQFREASLAFAKALEGEDPSAKLYGYAARSLMHTGEVDLAIGYLKKAIAKDSESGTYHYYLSMVYEMKGVPNLTKKYADMAKSRGFTGTDETFNNAATQHYNQGIDFYNEERYMEAVQEYMRAIKMNKTKVKYHYNLALTYKKMDRIKEAKATLKTAISVDPSHANSHKLMGDVLYKKEEFKKAASYYKEAITLGNKEYLDYMFVGYCYDKLEMYNGALEYFLKAEDKNPDHFEVRFTVAMAYFRLESLDNAKNRFEALYDTHPENTRVLTNLTTLYYITSEYKIGLERCLEWVKIAPSDGEAYNQTGNMYFALGKTKEAADYKRKAKRLGSKKAAIY
jgi:tetratricopeptide (TPR) repeat protein